jgi:diguanylate cyclase (GGDEF)-like protein
MPHTLARRRVLLVDSADGPLAACASAALDHGLDVGIVEPAHAGDELAAGLHRVVAIDLDQAGAGGGALIDELCSRFPVILFVAIARGDGLTRGRSHQLESAIAAIVPCPFDSDQLMVAFSEAFDLHERRARNRPVTLDGTTVLLVEDNPGDAELVLDHLSETCNAIVTRCSRLDDAMRALLDITYDFVISDLSLPDARGLEAVRRLQPLAPSTPLIVLTGLDDEYIAIQALQDGAQDYLVKNGLTACLLHRTLRHARERKQVSNRLQYMTRHDVVTGVANRAALRERIGTTLARGQRHALAFAVLYIDLDRFKTINDNYGHDAGDAVLREVSARLRKAVRNSDLVARLGGDEFAVFLDDVDSAWCPVEIAERMLHGLERPIAVDGRELVVSASIGVARYPEVRGSVDDLLKAADSAMYVAKGQGRNNVQVYGAVADAHRTRLALTADLQQALQRGELSLDFQPQYTVDGGRVVAFEALLRWNRRGAGWVSPAEFIPLLEDNGRIVAVGEWVLDRACEQLARWRAVGWSDLRMAVNLSARQIAHRGLVDCVRGCLERHAVPARCIELEITERVVMGDTERAKTTLAQLRALGVRLAIDDFGTGYSSLAYLSRFAVDCLKIDRSFIDDVDKDRERALITSAIVTLGHHLGLDVVAEGVETSEQLAFLTAARCDLVQGYLLGRPAAAKTFGMTARLPVIHTMLS